MNKVILTGIVVKEAKVIFEREQHKKVSFTMSVQKHKNGYNYITVVAYDSVADLVIKWCKPNKFLNVEGRVETYVYDKDDGQKLYGKDIVADKIQFYNNVEFTKNVLKEDTEVIIEQEVSVKE
jgi:single-stranded DNA-binding protein